MNIDDFRNGRHVVYKLHAHVVLVTKYRRGVMTDRVSKIIGDTFQEVAERRGFTIDAFETDHDHAHVLISYPPKLSLSSIVLSLKTISSQRVRAEKYPEVRKALWGEHFWSPSYCVVSCGGAPLDIVKAYVENQKQPNKSKGRPSGRG